MNTLQRILSRLETALPKKPSVPDRHFVIEDTEDGLNGVFGYPSGFCYATYADVLEAQQELDRLVEQNSFTKNPTVSGKAFAAYYKLPRPAFSHVPGEELEIVWKLGPKEASKFVKALRAKKMSPVEGYQPGDVATYRFFNMNKDYYEGTLFINEDNIVVALHEED